MTELLYIVYSNCFELLKDRKYEIITKKLSKSEFISIYEKNRSDIHLKCRSQTIVIVQGTKLNIEEAKRVIKNVKNKHIIVVVNIEKNITKNHLNLIKKYSKTHKIEIIKMKLLYVNIPKHDIQPKFTILSKEQIIYLYENSTIGVTPMIKMSLSDNNVSFYKKSLINGKNIAKILNTDPVCIWYGTLTPGQIFAIKKVTTYDSYCIYRIVVDVDKTNY